jgi:hypothetical protein
LTAVTRCHDAACALYFLDLLDREQKHQDDPASFLERTLRRFEWALAADALDEYRAFTQRQMLAIVRAIRTPAASPGDPLVARWNALDGKLGGPGLEAADVAPPIEIVGELLDVSAPTAPLEIFDSILRQSLLSLLRVRRARAHGDGFGLRLSATQLRRAS